VRRIEKFFGTLVLHVKKHKYAKFQLKTFKGS